MCHLSDLCRSLFLSQALTSSCARHTHTLALPLSAMLLGVVSFDNIGNAVLTMFVGITLEGWTGVMYLLQDSLGWYPATLFMVRCQHLNPRTSTSDRTNSHSRLSPQRRWHW